MTAARAKQIELQSLELAGIIRRGDTVMWGQSVAEPLPLTQALAEQRQAIGRFGVFLGVTLSENLRPEHADCIAFSAYCGNGSNRAFARAGVLDILPVHYSQLPALLLSGRLKIDVLMLQLAPADAQGNYSLSMAHEYLVPAIRTARVVIAEVNDQAPWTFGECSVRDEDLDYIVRTSRPPLELHQPAAGPAELAVANRVAGLIEDGSTLQFGLGALPEAVLSALAGHRDLGIHSGAIGDKVADLMEAGVITNARKNIDRGVAVAGVMFGSKRIQQFCHRNPAVQFRSTAYTHDPAVLAGLDRFVALNSAIEVDLTGQVNAETAGGTYVGAMGGAADFLRGAGRSAGGLPVVALASTAGRHSRIVARINGPASTPRSDAGVIVTEHGVADLRGAPISERIRKMIDIAHPDFREQLARDAHNLPGRQR